MRKVGFEHVFGSSLMLVALVFGTTGEQTAVGNDTTPKIDWRTSHSEAIEESARDGKPVLIRITATWCGPCQQMKQLTFSDSRVVEVVRSNFVALSIDADKNPELVTSYRIEAYPTTIILSSENKVLQRLTGFQAADRLMSALLPLAKTEPKVETLTPLDDVASALDPTNGIKYGFDGYCLVSLLEDARVLRGLPEFIAEHRGQTICFTSDEQREKFLEDPEKYWPVANGKCLVSSREGVLSGPGDPRMAVTWRGRTWLFSDRECQRRFIKSPLYYAGEILVYSGEM